MKMKPVSYTHLDVYKRQAHKKFRRKIAGPPRLFMGPPAISDMIGIPGEDHLPNGVMYLPDRGFFRLERIFFL